MRNNFTILLMSLFFAFESFAQTVYVSEDFNGTSLPSGWSRAQAAGSDGWEFGTPASISSASFPILPHTGNITGANDDQCNCNATIDYLISPTVAIPAAGAAVLQFDVFYGNLSYQGVTESATIEVTTNGGATWTSVYTIPGDITAWQTYTVNLSAYAGQTIQVGFHYDDNGGWLYGIGIDNVTIFEPAANDASLASLDMPASFLKNVDLPVKGSISNQGTNTINAIELFWSDGSNVYKDSLTGLNIASLASYNFTHSDSINYSVPGNYTIDVWTGAINGVVDQNNSNDTTSITIEIVDTLVQRMPLHEVFTSSTCGPCNPGNANLNSIFNPNPGKQIVLKYQMSWPGTGDPYFTNEGADRRTYYGVNAVPNMFVDGGWDDNTNSYTAGLRDQFYDVPAYMDIHSEIRVECKSVFVDVTVTPFKDFPGNNILHLAVIEYLTFNNIKTNGETSFDHVMKKMMPNSNGTSIGALVKNVPQTFTLNYTFNGNYTLPANATNPVNHANANTIEEYFDLDVVAFVQNNGTKEVFQATYSQDMIGFDISLKSLNAINNPTIGNPVAIGGMIENWKDSSATSMQINYSVDGGAIVSETINTLSLNSKGDDLSFSFQNSWIPASAGVHNLKVWIDNFNSGSSNDGSPCNDTIEVSLTVASGSAPVADFIFAQTAGLNYQFTDASSSATSWAWDFGDGNSSTSQNPSHTYTSNANYNVCLVASNVNGSDSICKSVNALGIQDLILKSAVSISPNPSSGMVELSSSLELNGQVIVHDILGRVVYQKELSNISNLEINLSNIEKGIYLIKVINESSQFTERLIIE